MKINVSRQPIHFGESDPDDDLYCAICHHHGNIELALYRGEWWCEECIIAEEEYEHDMAIRG